MKKIINLIFILLFLVVFSVGCTSEDNKPTSEEIGEIMEDTLKEKDRQEDNDICIVASYIYGTPFGDTIEDRAESMKNIIGMKEEDLTNTEVVITKISTREMTKSLEETLDLYEVGQIEFTKEEYKVLSDLYNYLSQVMNDSKEFQRANNHDNKKWTQYMKEDTFYIAKMYSGFLTYK